MALLRNIDQVLATQLRISRMDEDEKIPDIEEAQRIYLLPLLGAPLMADLETTLTNIAAANPTTETVNLRKLLAMVQKPLAAFAYHQNLAAMHVRITDSGVRRTTTDNMPAAYKWEYDEAMQYLEERAYSTLDAALSYLFDNAALFANFNNSAAHNAQKHALFASGAVFGRYVRIHHPFSTFAALQPLVANAEQMFIEPTIGADFYRLLLTSTDNPVERAYALDLARNAVANLCIFIATQKMPCRIGPHGFTVLAGQKTNGGERNQATAPTIESTGESHKIFGEKFLYAMFNYLNTKASTTVWPTYFSSTFYLSPTAQIINRKNDARKIYRF